jgi:hypothetical protein
MNWFHQLEGYSDCSIFHRARLFSAQVPTPGGGRLPRSRVRTISTQGVNDISGSCMGSPVCSTVSVSFTKRPRGSSTPSRGSRRFRHIIARIHPLAFQRWVHAIASFGGVWSRAARRSHESTRLILPCLERQHSSRWIPSFPATRESLVASDCRRPLDPAGERVQSTIGLSVRSWPAADQPCRPAS